VVKVNDVLRFPMKSESWLRISISAPVILSGLLASLAAEARQSLSLSGTWQYQKVAQLTYPPPNTWSTTTVPGYLDGYNYERAWFRRSATLPAFGGDRVKLRFGGVKYNSTVRVNGQVVGGCVNGYNPFELDITAAARASQANEILVGLTDWTGLFSAGVDFSNLAPGEGPRDRPRDVVFAPIGGHYNLYGLWEAVTVEILPPVNLADVFVQPSVRDGQLKVRVRVRNESAAAVTATLANRVLDQGAPMLTFAPQDVSLAAGETADVVVVADWADAHLWDVDDPYLYQLETTLTPSIGAPDTLTTRFGFREFWPAGDSLFLNGIKRNLNATSCWPPTGPMTRNALRQVLLDVKAGNNLAFRLHTQPWPELWYQVADEVGLLIVEEAAVWCDPRAYRLNDPVFWQNYADHLRAAVQRDQNHPALIMWSLENEILHCGGDGLSTNAITELAKLGQLVKSLDPTRPITYEADLDPGGVADVIGLHYPHEYPDFLLWPDTAYWMDQPIKKSYAPGGQWTWDRAKPLYIGEFLWVADSAAAAFTPLFGDIAYADPSTFRNQAKGLTWQMQIEAYRDYGVSALCPWTMFEDPAATGGAAMNLNPTRNYLYQVQAASYHPNAVTLREYDRRFFVGESVSRTLNVFNDTPAAGDFTLRWGVGVSRESRTIAIDAAGKRTETFAFTAPVAEGDFLLGIELLRGAEVVFSNTLACTALTRSTLAAPLNARLALFDPAGITAPLFLREGVPFVSVTNLATEAYAGFNLLVIGRDALTNSTVPEVGSGGIGGRWDAFMKGGGWIVVLEQTNYPSWMPLALTLANEASHFAFPVSGHPIVADLTSEGLRWWRGDHRVAHRQIRVPSRGNFQVLAHIGTLAGLDRAGLLEVRRGRGGLLASQLRVSERFEVEPLAGRLLQRLLDYAAAGSTTPGRHVGLLAESDSAAAQTLNRLGLLAENVRSRADTVDLSSYPLVLVAGGSNAWSETQTQLNRLTNYVAAGGTLWLHRPPDTFLNAVGAGLFAGVVWETNLTLPVLRSDPTTPPTAFTTHDLYWTDDAGSWNRPVVYATNIATRALRKQFALTNTTTLQVEAMPIKTSGSAVAGGWVLNANGYVAQDITVAQAGPYLFGVTARGTPAYGVYPRLSLRMDGVFQDAVNVNSSSWRQFTLSASLTAGTHELALVFDNDAYNPPEDRNLYLDRVDYGLDTSVTGVRTLTRPGVLAEATLGRGRLLLDEVNWEAPGQHVAKAERLLSALFTERGARIHLPAQLALEAEEMTPVGNPASGTNNGVVWLYSQGSLQRSVRFNDTGAYQFEITGQGTPAQGVYPLVELRIDGANRGRASVNSSTPVTLTLTTNVTAGLHTVALAFINDLHAPPDDRNLGLDRLVIRPEPRPEIVSAGVASNPTQFDLAWTASPGRSYNVESRADVSTNAWTVLGTNAAVGTVTTWADDGSVAGAPPVSATRPQSYYRIRTRLP
jgi:hypothetical protein